MGREDRAALQVGWPEETRSSRPSVNLTLAITCDLGTATWDAARSGPATRFPSASSVQTRAPTSRSRTGLAPDGVSIIVSAERQMGAGLPFCQQAPWRGIPSAQ